MHRQTSHNSIKSEPLYIFFAKKVSIGAEKRCICDYITNKPHPFQIRTHKIKRGRGETERVRYLFD